ncbi:aminoacyltransferase e1 ubiquitin-activating enzyme-related [Anaeramoeba ignava]|uniref:Aminoacyltransferase e1 ubiquitin-activating enzyme-related n=1 Tax=Anaeramoeba ignava TaxID=1746090 RepID=A0A9Q0LQ48_ANAIG|nr:aminoacyltransferase e1 ubiquitin-activating enzyme-related [Anaeramoeba ignava]
MKSSQRLAKEYSKIQKSDNEFNISIDSNNILNWKAILKGPDETPFKNGNFEISIKCTDQYPMKPPKVFFNTPIFHPNIHFKTGEVCLDVLKANWSPAWDIFAICRAISLLLSHPEPDSPLNCDAGNMLRAKDEMAYFSMGEMYTQMFAIKENSDKK